MQNRPRGNEYRTTLVCVDGDTDGVLAGCFYNPQCPGGKEFQSLSRFLIQMEDMLDGMQMPQSYTAARGFSGLFESKEGKRPRGEKPQEGKLATFAIRILFRQNASWQGSVAWLEGGREDSFRSVLELIFLMDSALRDLKVE